jgi:hypothetical protein
MTNASFSIQKYGRYFGVYEGLALVCVCLYRRGAARVIERINEALSYQEDQPEKQKLKGGIEP